MRVRRRQIVELIAALCVTHATASADDAGLAEAASFIRDAGNRLASVAQGHPTDTEKRRRLETFLDDVVDIGGVARFCLGRFWAVATPQQQPDYVQLFRLVLVKSVAARVGDYPTGQLHVTINIAERVGSAVQVPTVVFRNENDPPARVTWILGEETGRLRITDIVAEGISLRITQRSDYASFLKQNNYDISVLLRALKDQVGPG